MPYKYSIVVELARESLELKGWTQQAVCLNDIFFPDNDISTSAPKDIFNTKTKSKGSEVDLLVGAAEYQTPTDKRFGRITIGNIDLECLISSSSSNRELEESANMSLSSTGTIISSSSSHRPFKGLSMVGAPRAKFLGNGIIHLYCEGEDEGNMDEDDIICHTQTESGDSTSERGSEVLAILAVPGYMTASDLLGFIGKDCRESVSHLRMLRSAAPNRYMVLMKFRNKERTDIFYRDYNCKMFNSMEPETCHIVYVNSINFRCSTFSEFPHLLDDEFTPLSEQLPLGDKKRRGRTPSIPSGPPGVLTKPTPPPTRALRELPTCPVCLERMDSSVTGLLTIICQHTFHCQCLSKWGDNSCPVCRYSQKKDHQSMLSDPNQCSVCGTTESLWICLICGSIGCGRYEAAHAFQHYIDTNHFYAMDMESQRVWDYAGDGYVHRLIQNEADGKLVELPSLASSSANDGASRGYNESTSESDYVPREKLDSIGMEYTYLLTSQLESQRSYFEDKIATAADKASAALEKLEKIQQESEKMQMTLSSIVDENSKLKNELPSLQKEYEKAKKKADSLQTISKSLEKEWREEKIMNENMVKKLELLTKERTEKDREIEDLREQLRDVMLYLDAQQKFKDMEEDVQQGTAFIGSNNSSKKKGKKTKR
ncbi:BRCA1-associated protein 2-domain-containing protein [Dipodascopsis uninucleata]